MKRPLIGITCYIEEKLESEKKFITSPLYISYPEYADCVTAAGGLPVNIPVVPGPETEEMAERLDGLVVCGGEDVFPGLYNEVPLGNFRYVHERDRFELALVDAFYKMRKPILGICRGMQLINVYLGGSLIQDIRTESPDRIDHARADMCTRFVHKVKLRGKLAERFGDELSVNSMHHQAVRRLGDGLVVEAVSEDGIVEAARSTKHPYLGLVQWHPEMLGEKHRKIFGWLVEAAFKAGSDRSRGIGADP